MGCDIHCTLERKVDGVWVAAIPDLDLNRDYGLFAALAGVRNYPTRRQPIAIPRGTPTDVSPEHAQMLRDYGCDAHSASWVTLTELLAYAWDGPYDGNGVELTRVVCLASNGLPSDDVRIVFFFDN